MWTSATRPLSLLRRPPKTHAHKPEIAISNAANLHFCPEEMFIFWCHLEVEPPLLLQLWYILTANIQTRPSWGMNLQLAEISHRKSRFTRPNVNHFPGRSANRPRTVAQSVRLEDPPLHSFRSTISSTGLKGRQITSEITVKGSKLW